MGRGRMNIARMLGCVVLACGLVAPAGPAAAQDGLDEAGYAHFQDGVAGLLQEYWTSIDRVRPYRPPGLVFTAPGRTTASACGAVSADPAEPAAAKAAHAPAFYCPADATIYLATGWMYREIYGGFGDFAAAAVLAHEWAHHVQVVTGTRHRTVRDGELQADCLAGAWAAHVERAGLLEAGDLVEAGAALHAVGDVEFDSPDHHGTPQERMRSFVRGHQDAKACEGRLP